MAEINDSRRVKMTKALLQESLIDIMKTKSIHNISIKEICTGADINRSTFYRHYNTQYELYDEITNEILSELIEIFLESRKTDDDFSDSITKVLEFIEKKREVCLVILSDKGNVTMGESFVKAISPIADSEASDIMVYIYQFVAAGLTNVLWVWLNNPNRRSPREFAQLMTSIMKRGVYKTLIRQAVIDMKKEKETESN